MTQNDTNMTTLPFLPEFHEAVRSGRKTATARSKPYGKPGDRVQGPGCTIVLEHVVQAPLGEIASHHYWIEGLESKEEFVAIWNKIHPRKPFNPSTFVYFHRFHVEGKPPVCEAGWDLLSDDEKKRFPNWGPIMPPEIRQ